MHGFVDIHHQFKQLVWFGNDNNTPNEKTETGGKLQLLCLLIL